MKKRQLLSMAIIVFAFVFPNCYAINSDFGTKTLNEGEIATKVYSYIWGEPDIAYAEKMNDYDDINSRFVFIGNKSYPSDLVVMIRVSDERLYYWPLELNKKNLLQAKTILDEDAPFCCVAKYIDEKLEKSSVFVKSLQKQFAYKDFLNAVEDIMKSVPEELESTVNKTDPFLAAFPGINWKMSKDDIKLKYGKDQFEDLEVALLSSKMIDNESFSYTFLFAENKLLEISVSIPEERLNYYYDMLVETYGTPIMTTYIDFCIGRLIETTDGDAWAWQIGTTNICISNSTIKYRPMI